MKKIWILFLVGIFIGACSSFKKREEQLKARYEALVRTNISQQFSQMNHQKIATQGANQVEEIEFVLDSLYFQPDSGFRLKAGFVRAKIRRLSTSFNHLEQSHDTLRSQFQEEAKLTKKKEVQQEIKSQQRRQQKPWFLLGGLLFLFALVASYWLWKQR